MTETSTSIRPAIVELERAFTELRSLFKREMPLPTITIQSRGRKSALGWFAPNRWQDGEPTPTIDEINICAESLAEHIEEIADTLIHEMVHYANKLDGIKDCSAGGQYHNKRFRDAAIAVGLLVEKGPRGWAHTSLSPELRERVASIKLDPAAFAICRHQCQHQKQETRMKKWRCRCTIIRAAVEVNAQCRVCGCEFKQQG